MLVRRVMLGMTIAGMVAAAAPALLSAQQPVTDTATKAADARYAAKDWKGAVTLYARLVADRPNDGRSWYRYGVSLYNSGDAARAAAAFERSAAIGRNPFAVFNAASAHAASGHADRAFVMLDSAVTLGLRSEATLRGDTALMRYERDARFGAALARMRRLANPCVDRPEAHRFDFWIGDWDVTTPQGQPAGHNRIEQILGQCALLENWTDPQGGEGKSLTTYNAQRKMWQQFWVAQSGTVTEYRESEWDGPSLRFLARATLPDGEPQLVRMTFTPIDSATVRQFGELSTDDGKTWSVTFDLVYRRKR